MSLATGRTNLIGAIKTLQQKWEKVRVPWNDPVAREFDPEQILFPPST